MADEKPIDLADIGGALKRRIERFEAGVKAGTITPENFDARKLFTGFRSALPGGGGTGLLGSGTGFDPRVAGVNGGCDEGCGAR